MPRVYDGKEGEVQVTEKKKALIEYLPRASLAFPVTRVLYLS